MWCECMQHECTVVQDMTQLFSESLPNHSLVLLRHYKTENENTEGPSIDLYHSLTSQEWLTPVMDTIYFFPVLKFSLTNIQTQIMGDR